jgi:two-component system, LytTR family, response regulator
MNKKNKITNNKRIVLPGIKNKTIENPEDIIFIEADDHYVHIYFRDGHSIMFTVCLKNIEKELDTNVFFHSHKSFILNMNFVRSCRKYGRGLIAELVAGYKISVAKRLVKDFKRKSEYFPSIKWI